MILVLARAISVEDMGVFSAFTNLVLILSSISDPGITSGLVRYVSEFRTKKQFKKEKRFIAAGLKIQLVIFFTLAFLMFSFASETSRNLLGTDKSVYAHLAVVAIFIQILWAFSSQVLKAQKRFSSSVFVDITASTGRLAGVVFLVIAAVLSLKEAVFYYAIGPIAAVIIGFYLLGGFFIFTKNFKSDFSKLISFSSWLGINKISSVISGRIDIQMLALLAGSVSTGLYSIPSRLIFFVTLLVGSLSSAIAPRLASFSTRKQEISYLRKVTLLSLCVTFGLIAWYTVATPFIVILFGDKYIESVQIFRLLILSTIPFVLTVPPINAIIYSLKKPKYVGYFSIFQLIAVVTLNLVFIPRYGSLGPTYTLIITNTMLAIYSWYIVIKYYYYDEN